MPAISPISLAAAFGQQPRRQFGVQRREIVALIAWPGSRIATPLVASDLHSRGLLDTG
jgi:hypothetical protein